MIKKDFVEIIWSAQGKETRRIVKKNHLKIIFETFVDCFQNNLISKQFVKLMPDIEKLVINQDFNDTQDIPFVEYYRKSNAEGDRRGIIKIPRVNKIIWSILQEVGEEQI